MPAQSLNFFRHSTESLHFPKKFPTLPLRCTKQIFKGAKELGHSCTFTRCAIRVYLHARLYVGRSPVCILRACVNPTWKWRKEKLGGDRKWKRTRGTTNAETGTARSGVGRPGRVAVSFESLKNCLWVFFFFLLQRFFFLFKLALEYKSGLKVSNSLEQKMSI